MDVTSNKGLTPLALALMKVGGLGRIRLGEWTGRGRGGAAGFSAGCFPTHNIYTTTALHSDARAACPTLQGPANIETICLLVELGANVDALLAQRSLETPLHIAARSGRADIIERLVKCPQISATCRTKDGSTALHYGAAFGQTHVLAPLVAAGCPVDSRDNALNTPLHLAAGERQQHSACTAWTAWHAERAAGPAGCVPPPGIHQTLAEFEDLCAHLPGYTPPHMCFVFLSQPLLYLLLCCACHCAPLPLLQAAAS